METKKKIITLHRGLLAPGQYVASPFVTKLELRLRLAGLPYAVGSGSARSSPKGKVPYVTLPDGEVISDSALIVRRLEERGSLTPLDDAALTETEKAQALCVRALMEDRLYFYQMRERWLDNYTLQRDTVLQALPWPVRYLVGWLIHRAVTSALHGQGTRRFSAAEVTRFKTECWSAVNTLLEASFAQKKRQGDDGSCFWVMGGSAPTDADLSVYGFVAGVLASESAPESKALVKSFPVVLRYAERVHTTWFPDYEGFSI